MEEKEFIFKRVPSLTYVSSLDNGLVVDWDKDAKGAEKVAELLNYYRAKGHRVPNVLSKTQFVMALHGIGMSIDSIYALIERLPDDKKLLARIAFENEPTISRYNDLILVLGAKANLSDEALDDLFIAGGAISI